MKAKKFSRWSEEEIQFVKTHYETMSRTEIARELGRTFGAVKTMCDKRLKIRKSAEGLKHVLKRSCGLKTRFTKGHAPVQTLFPGAITIRHERGRNKDYIRYYWYIRLEDKWEKLHVYMWTLKNGPVPKGYIVVFKNKNSLDVRYENLEMITFEENMKRNSGSLSLSDTYIAGIMSGGDRQLQKALLKNNKELIDLNRQKILTNKSINGNNKKN